MKYFASVNLGDGTFDGRTTVCLSAKTLNGLTEAIEEELWRYREISDDYCITGGFIHFDETICAIRQNAEGTIEFFVTSK